MTPTMNKKSTGKERTVRSCESSENTSRGPLRTSYMTVLGEILSKIQNDKKVILEGGRQEDHEVKGIPDKSTVRTTHLQGARLVCVQGLWCHMFNVCM